jgi:penicillin-binding protein 1C
MNDAAALVVDNQTGQVLAYLGNIGTLSSAISVDGVRAHRQAGSTLKPFLYSLALEQKYLTASSKLDDSVTDFSLGTGSVYQPKDFDHEYHGDAVTLRLALASSLNIPAVKTLQLIGVGRLIEQMNALGFQNLRSEEFYGPSLALGTADVSLWELVNAYRTLANGGRWSPLTLSPLPEKQVPFKNAISSEASFIIADILSDKMSRSLTFGLDSPLSLRFWTAAKTGTSKDMKDNWCIGFSSRYTVGVWAGNFSGAPMWNVTGVSGAAPAWAEIMEVLHRSATTLAHKDLVPKPPRGVLHVKGEWYIRGTEPSPLLVHAEAKPTHATKILYPVEGLMIARDPDIPPDHQKVFFESNLHHPSDKWVLNHQELASAQTSHAWQPDKPGHYKLQLVSSTGKVLDQVHFSVRGAASPQEREKIER